MLKSVYKEKTWKKLYVWHICIFHVRQVPHDSSIRNNPPFTEVNYQKKKRKEKKRTQLSYRKISQGRSKHVCNSLVLLGTGKKVPLRCPSKTSAKYVSVCSCHLGSICENMPICIKILIECVCLQA